MLLKAFYEQDTLKVAQGLLGCFLVRKVSGKKIKAKIVEVEAYDGYDDKASHVSRGRTSRTEIMFNGGGVIYIYLVYGMHYMLNIVTGVKDYPAAVLIRALEPMDDKISDKKIYSGPGKLTKNLKIDSLFNSLPVYKKENGLWIERGEVLKKKDIIKTKRIGIDYAEEYRNKKWRFYIKNNPYVSAK